MIYLDTSVLSAVFFREARAPDLVSRLEGLREERLMIAAWTLTEMASAGGIKQRTGAVDDAMHQAALANFKRLASTHLGTVEIEPADFRTAAVLIETPASLPAGDALHLAVARRLQARIATLDHGLRQAAETLGLLSVPLVD